MMDVVYDDDDDGGGNDINEKISMAGPKLCPRTGIA